MFSHANKESLVFQRNNRCVDISRLNYLHLDQAKVFARETRMRSGSCSVLLCKNYIFHLVISIILGNMIDFYNPISSLTMKFWY